MLVERINKAINKVLISIGGVIGFLTMFLVVSNVVSRYLLLPIEGVVEIIELSLVFIVFLSITYTQIVGGHIKVTFLTSRLPHRLKIRLGFFTTVLCLCISSCFCLGTFRFALASWIAKETTVGGTVPIYPAKMVIFFGFFLLSVQMVLEILQKLRFQGNSPNYVK